MTTNFPAVAAAFRDQSDAAEYRRKRREKWLARPLNEREWVIRDNLINAMRGMSSEFTTEQVVDDVQDYIAGDVVELRELLNAVAEEEPQRAWESLDRVLCVIAKIKHEDEY